MRGCALVLLAVTVPGLAQQVDHSAHADHQEHAGQTGEAAAPAAPADHAADAVYGAGSMAAARELLYAEAGGMRTGALVLELAELRLDGGTSWRVEGSGWYGGDRNRLLLRLDGEVEDGRVDEARLEVLYSRHVAAYWNLVAGVRGDPRPDPSRGFAALGVAGLAPYGIEMRATAYVSDEGEVEARIEADGGLQLTQRWVLEPRLTLDLSMDDVPERQLGQGVPKLELGLRLRWEHKRRFVPYFGAEWQGSFGNTARYVVDAGDDPRVLRFVAGISAWL
jgi:copper resistance protein B